MTHTPVCKTDIRKRKKLAGVVVLKALAWEGGCIVTNKRPAFNPPKIVPKKVSGHGNKNGPCCTKPKPECKNTFMIRIYLAVIVIVVAVVKLLYHYIATTNWIS